MNGLINNTNSKEKHHERFQADSQAQRVKQIKCSLRSSKIYLKLASTELRKKIRLKQKIITITKLKMRCSLF